MNDGLIIVGTGGLYKQLPKNLFNPYKEIFLYNEIENIHGFDGLKVINNPNQIPKTVKHFIIAVSNPLTRKNLTSRFLSYGLKGSLVLAEDLSIPYTCYLGNNIIILNKCILEGYSKIFYGCLVNVGCQIHHDCELGEFVELGPRVTLLGNVTVGDSSFIGAGTIVKEKVKIGRNCIIGMGSIVLQDIPDGSLAYGNPCKIIRN